MEKAKAALGLLAIVALVVGAFLFNAKAPCGWFKYSRIHDIPARCLTVVKR